MSEPTSRADRELARELTDAEHRFIGQLATMFIRLKVPTDYEGMFVRAEEEYRKLAEFKAFDELLAQVRLEAPNALPCGCIPATIVPNCTKKHTGYALMLPPGKRPEISLDLEEYQ